MVNMQPLILSLAYHAKKRYDSITDPPNIVSEQLRPRTSNTNTIPTDTCMH